MHCPALQLPATRCCYNCLSRWVLHFLLFFLKNKTGLTYSYLFQRSHIWGTLAAVFCPHFSALSLQDFVFRASLLTGFTDLSTQHTLVSLILVTQACLDIRIYTFKLLKLSPGTRIFRHIALTMNAHVLWEISARTFFPRTTKRLRSSRSYGSPAMPTCKTVFVKKTVTGFSLFHVGHLEWTGSCLSVSKQVTLPKSAIESSLWH